MDDDVDVACFVFQCDEYCSFGGLGALTPGHYAAGPGQASVGVVTAQGCRRNEASGLQGRAQQSDGVSPQSQTQRAIVGCYFLSFGRASTEWRGVGKGCSRT